VGVKAISQHTPGGATSSKHAVGRSMMELTANVLPAGLGFGAVGGGGPAHTETEDSSLGLVGKVD